MSYKTQVITSAQKAEEICASLRNFYTGVIGFDTETYHVNLKTIQSMSSSSTFLVQASRTKRIPPLVRRLVLVLPHVLNQKKVKCSSFI